MARFAVILAAAGKSTRFRDPNKRKKPFIDLKGRAVWVRAAEVFVNRDDVVQSLIAISPDDMEWFKEKFRPNLAFMEIEIVEGGASRAESVYNALQQVRDDVDFVAIHDAARPLITRDWVTEVFQAAEANGAAIPALPASATLKRVDADNQIVETISREGLWAAQTPQVFRRELLLEAFEKRGELNATDEAQLVEQLGHKVKVVRGWPMNIKLTSSADLGMAIALVNALPKPKGIGPLHPFADEEPRSLF